jgi:hypothetical protein
VGGCQVRTQRSPKLHADRTTGERRQHSPNSSVARRKNRPAQRTRQEP